MGIRKQLIVSLIFGLIGALCAAGFMLLYAQGMREKQEQLAAKFGGTSPDVLTAKKPIYPGEEIKASDFRPSSWANYLLPEQPVMAADVELLKGKVAGALILPGEVLSKERLATDTSLLRELAPDHSAIAVSVNPTYALGGQLLPGMFVDLYSSTKNRSAALLVEKAEVLFTNSTVSDGQGKQAGGLLKSESKPTKIEWVTLSVSDAIVDQVVSASLDGNVYLTLPGTKGISYEK